MKLQALPVRAFTWLEQFNLSYTQAISVIATAILARIFVENFTNANNGGALNGFIDTLFHYPLWFATIFLATMFILATVGKTPVSDARTVVSLFSFVILLPPLIDIFAYGFIGQRYDFIADDAGATLLHFITLTWSSTAIGVGIKTEIALVLATIALYVKYKSGSVLRAVTSALLVYVVIFVLLILPTIGATLHHVVSGAQEPALTQKTLVQFYAYQEPLGSYSWPRPVLSDRRDASGRIGTSADDHFSLSMSAMLLVCFVGVLALLYRRATSRKWKALVANFRFTRIIYYLLFLTFGAYVGIATGTELLSGLSLADTLTFLALALAVVFGWLFSVWENDEVDQEIDRISNPGRPKITGVFSEQEWTEQKWTFLTLSLIAASIAGWYALTFIVLFLFIYHAYSCAPLRLKRVPVLSSVLVGVQGLLITLAGYFLFSGTEYLGAFPSNIALGIVVAFTLAENIKNIKDIEGDRAEGIRTVPSMLGEKWGKKVAAGLAGLGAFLLPVFLGFSISTGVLGFVFAFGIYVLASRKRYAELPVFLAYFAYVALLAVVYGTGLAQLAL